MKTDPFCSKPLVLVAMFILNSSRLVSFDVDLLTSLSLHLAENVNHVVFICMGKCYEQRNIINAIKANTL